MSQCDRISFREFVSGFDIRYESGSMIGHVILDIGVVRIGITHIHSSTWSLLSDTRVMYYATTN